MSHRFRYCGGFLFHLTLLLGFEDGLLHLLLFLGKLLLEPELLLLDLVLLSISISSLPKSTLHVNGSLVLGHAGMLRDDVKAFEDATCVGKSFHYMVAINQ